MKKLQKSMTTTKNASIYSSIFLRTKRTLLAAENWPQVQYLFRNCIRIDPVRMVPQYTQNQRALMKVLRVSCSSESCPSSALAFLVKARSVAASPIWKKESTKVTPMFRMALRGK